MGHQKKGFNAKARSRSANQQNLSSQSNSVIIEVDDKEKYDESNPLVFIPTSKKKEKAKEKNQAVPKPLSKKQRKKLEKVIESKKKKLNRAELFKKLSEVQATTEDISKLTSTSDMQTYGIKRLTNEDHKPSKRQKISNLKGINKESESESSDLEEESTDKDEDFLSEEQEEIISEETNTSKDETEIQTLAEEKLLDTKTKSPNNSDESNIARIPTVFIPVHRNPEIQAAREALPIYSEEQPLIEAIKENPVVIVHGETGSGKTTQVPQFLYEAGFTQNNMLIGITEPRRIAAMSMAARVGEEMSMLNAVSYHIRYDKTVNPETRIKFMTDGVLLKEIKRDFFLSKYSVIIIDEAHERSVFSDVLIGLLSRIVRRDQIKNKKYPPLKLIIMSATMCVEEFMENKRLFKTTPFLFKVSSRQYAVQAHFSKHTPEDYLEAAYQKVCKIHKQLPTGAILVFLTGEKEINDLCKKLQATFPLKATSKNQIEPDHDQTKKPKKKQKKEQHSFVPDINLDE